MFIGHFGLALAAKKIPHQPSLGTTFLAAQFIDLLWPFLLLAGVEKVSIEPGNTAFTPLNFESYPYSHSLAAVLIWAAIFGLVYYLLKKDRTGALLLGGLVVSHWLLDLLVHRPDLPLSFSEEVKVGLGLWNHKIATVAVEGLIFLGGAWWYISSTRAKNKTGQYALWTLLFFWVAIYFMNIVGDPPPDSQSLGSVGLTQWLLVAWGYWADANRTMKEGRFTR